MLIRKTGSQIEFTTSDLEIQVRTTVELGGDAGNLATTVAARKLIDILRSLPADQLVSLTSNQNKMTLRAARAASPCRPAGDDFPLVQGRRLRPQLQRAAKTLKGLINQVHFAMAVHDIRYYLNGILFVAEGKA